MASGVPIPQGLKEEMTQLAEKLLQSSAADSATAIYKMSAQHFESKVEERRMETMSSTMISESSSCFENADQSDGDTEFLQSIDSDTAMNAAMKIQAGFRGHKARERVKKMKQTSVCDRTSFESVETFQSSSRKTTVETDDSIASSSVSQQKHSLRQTVGGLDGLTADQLPSPDSMLAITPDGEEDLMATAEKMLQSAMGRATQDLASQQELRMKAKIRSEKTVTMTSQSREESIDQESTQSIQSTVSSEQKSTVIEE